MAFLNEQGVERLWTHIVAKLGNKVDKVSGKALSTNDYTDDDKNKLISIFEQVSIDQAALNAMLEEVLV